MSVVTAAIRSNSIIDRKVELVVKNPPANTGDAGSVPELGRYPGLGNGNQRQHSCLENSMDGGAWLDV